jgi:nitroimidazol reductase NimA-like FMN-containing flavoprotein (pyridoxamine 5'-phosphate oxidase superfamily)
MAVDLSASEVDRYMLDSPRCILCISRGERAPLALPMWFGWIEGRIVMTTLAASRKVAHIRSHPEVACLVESGQDYFSLKAVLASGPCEVVDDDAQARRWGERINENKPMYERYFPEALPPQLERFYQRPRVALLVRPRSWTSWDFGKIPR